MILLVALDQKSQNETNIVQFLLLHSLSLAEVSKVGLEYAQLDTSKIVQNVRTEQSARCHTSNHDQPDICRAQLLLIWDPTHYNSEGVSGYGDDHSNGDHKSNHMHVIGDLFRFRLCVF